MRREDRDNLIRSFLAINAMLREEAKALKRAVDARREEAKHNPNWRLQPRAPKGAADGGQWVGGGGVKPASSASPKNKRPPRDHNRPGADSLQQIFPGIPNAPPSAILAPIDEFLGLSAPGRAANLQATRNLSQSLIQQIRRFDPNYRPPAFAEPGGFPSSISGRNTHLAVLRADLAAVVYRRTGDIRPLQVETLRQMQSRVDQAYSRAVREFEARRLSPRLSREEAIGNYVDAAVRGEMRSLYNRLNIDWSGSTQIGIQRREYDSSGRDLTYRIPDVRVGNVAFDATLARKTPGRAQIRGFFNADFRPEGVIIVRPSALGGSYYISRPASRAGEAR
jgi:hypothetical protein